MPQTIKADQIALNAYHEQNNWYAATPERQFEGRKAVIAAVFADNVADPDLLSWLPGLTADNSAARLLDTKWLYHAVVNVLEVVSQGDQSPQTEFFEKWSQLDEQIDASKEDVIGERTRAIEQLRKAGAAKGWKVTASNPPQPVFPFHITLN